VVQTRPAPVDPCAEIVETLSRPGDVVNECVQHSPPVAQRSLIDNSPRSLPGLSTTNNRLDRKYGEGSGTGHPQAPCVRLSRCAQWERGPKKSAKRPLGRREVKGAPRTRSPFVSWPYVPAAGAQASSTWAGVPIRGAFVVLVFPLVPCRHVVPCVPAAQGLSLLTCSR